MKAKVFGDFYVAKLKKVELEIWKTQCRCVRQIHTLTEVGAQSFSETLVNVKAEALDVEKKKVPAKKMTYAIT